MFLLIVVETIDAYAESFEFLISNSFVSLNGNGNNIHGNIAAVIGEILCRESLDGKAHVHDLGGMTVACGEVYDAAFTDEVNSLAGGQNVSVDIVAGNVGVNSVVLESGNIDFNIKVTCIGENCAVFHKCEVALGNEIVSAGNGA